MLFISNAYAQEAAAQPDIAANLIPLIIIFAIFYFLLIRPQQQKFKSHQEMVDNLKKNDEVVTGGGIIGKVTKVEDKILHVEISKGVEVKVNRSSVTEVLEKESKKESKTSKKK